MRTEAERNAEADRQRKELIESRNAADNAVYTAEKTLRDLGDKVPAELKEQVTSKVAAVRAAMNREDAQAMRSATEDLMQTVSQMGAAAYQQSGPAQSGPGPAGGPGPDENVVDGEFKDA
jgi:molecular chaperone DnaK